MTIAEQLAAWASGLRYQDIPPRIVTLAKAQAASVFASAHAGLLCDPGRQVLAAARRFGPAGKAPVLASGETFCLDTALMVNAALGMALDYDDYLFLGHTGHSAVWVPYLLGAEIGSSGEQVLAAQVAANEIAGRLGAACVLGPHNGQLWSHIHLAGAAVAAGMLLGLDQRQLTNALGIAYSQPGWALLPGFMGPGSKALTASTPCAVGLQAARLAAAGLGGSAAIFETLGGFLHQFTYRPLPSMLSGLGSAWVTDTLAIKPYPGCAYIDTTVDVVLSLFADIRARRGSFAASEVRRVEVEASLLTVGMNHACRAHTWPASEAGECAGRPPTPPLARPLGPIEASFDLPLSLALVLRHAELGAEQVADSALAAEQAELCELASRVRLRHSWRYTFELLAALDTGVGLGRFLGELTLRELLGVLWRARRDHGRGRLPLGWHQLRQLLAEAATLDRGLAGGISLLQRGFRGLLRPRKTSPNSPAAHRGLGSTIATATLDGVDFRGVRLPFGSRVTIELADGSSWRAESSHPRGSAARGDVVEVARDKLWREMRRSCPEERCRRAWETLEGLEAEGSGAVLAAVSYQSG